MHTRARKSTDDFLKILAYKFVLQTSRGNISGFSNSHFIPYAVAIKLLIITYKNILIFLNLSMHIT